MSEVVWVQHRSFRWNRNAVPTVGSCGVCTCGWTEAQPCLVPLPPTGILQSTRSPCVSWKKLSALDGLASTAPKVSKREALRRPF